MHFTKEEYMLVFARKYGEKVYVGNDIVLTVLDVGGGRVRLGFDCPVQIPVRRDEVYRRIRAKQQVAHRG
jgi:carbon storage regulator